MNSASISLVEDAFNSMVRTDYIPISETTQLNRIRKYYVDYFGHLRKVLSPQDHLIVGRRGTGKTTLLYRSLIECVESWSDHEILAKPRSLGIYLDLSKCQPITDKATSDFDEFEHVFAVEIVEALKAELNRTWPDLNKKPNIFERIFSNNTTKQRNETNEAIKDLTETITSGILRSVDAGGTQKIKNSQEKSQEERNSIDPSLSMTDPSLKGSMAEVQRTAFRTESESHVKKVFRLTIQDVLRNLGEIRKAAGISHIILLIDEFSSLNVDLQLRFTSLARKILGNHDGVYLKICAITDNYTLGSSIILQRDLFELPLDLDTYVERHGSLGAAMDGLKELAQSIVNNRLKAFGIENSSVFEDHEFAFDELSKAAMGVPRTLGIVLQQAWNRSITQSRTKIRKADIEYGVKYASKAYLRQFLGACGVAIPKFNLDAWDNLLQRAIRERTKSESGGASHFLALPEHEAKLKWLHMFFLVHLIESGRTTKKEKDSRNLYAFDYGICLDNNIKYDTDKNLVRQQRFAYDDCLQPFDSLFQRNREPEFRCPTCNSVFEESELLIGGKTLLTFCPHDRSDLEKISVSNFGINTQYTEEEIKIVGAIRSATPADRLLARRIADDVGCHTQKVSKFAEKLEKDHIINRKRDDEENKLIYYGPIQQGNGI